MCIHTSVYSSIYVSYTHPCIRSVRWSDAIPSRTEHFLPGNRFCLPNASKHSQMTESRTALQHTRADLRPVRTDNACPGQRRPQSRVPDSSIRRVYDVLCKRRRPGTSSGPPGRAYVTEAWRDLGGPGRHLPLDLFAEDSTASVDYWLSSARLCLSGVKLQVERHSACGLGLERSFARSPCRRLSVAGFPAKDSPPRNTPNSQRCRAVFEPRIEPGIQEYVLLRRQSSFAENPSR